MTAVADRPVVFVSSSRFTYRALRHLPDRLLHSRRHRKLLEALSASSPPQTILILCHGNICRSPYLQAALQRMLPATTVLSAGFLRSGRRIPEISLTITNGRGFDLSGFRSRTLSADVVERADLIIVMDLNQAAAVIARFHVSRSRVVIAGDLDPVFDSTRAIRDPWNATHEIFEAVFDRLDRCAAALASALNHGETG